MRRLKPCKTVLKYDNGIYYLFRDGVAIWHGNSQELAEAKTNNEISLMIYEAYYNAYESEEDE